MSVRWTLGVGGAAILALTCAVAWAEHEAGTLFKGTMKDQGGKTCASAVLKLSRSDSNGRGGMAKGCGWDYNFTERVPGHPEVCTVSESENSISFSCNYRGKGVSLVGSYSGTVCKDCSY